MADTEKEFTEEKELNEQEFSEETKEESVEENGETSKAADGENPKCSEAVGDENADASEMTDDENAENDADDKPGEKKIRGILKKKEKKNKSDEKIQELTDRLQRLMAEFDNYRKRTDKEKAAMFDMGTKSTLEKILPVVDNFERGLQSVPESDRDNPTYTGMDMIYKQLIKTLTDLGVEPIDATGKEFDPNLHNAVMQVSNEELPSGTVAQELQKGYTHKGSVLRHSMVSVVE